MAERVIIKTPKPYQQLVQRIEQSGGLMTYQFKYVDAIAADVPDAFLRSLRAGLPEGAVRKDLIVDLPAIARK